jgi:hypothetical protein
VLIARLVAGGVDPKCYVLSVPDSRQKCSGPALQANSQLSQIKADQYVSLLLPSLLVINTCSHMYVHVDLGLWISHSDLGQQSKISDHGKNAKAFQRWNRAM